jgi:hypothetical protein
MRSIVLIGKGESCLKSNKDFIEKHNDICIINQVVFSKKYEKFISNRADYQFINSSVDYYDEAIFDSLKLKKLYFHGREDQVFRSPPSYYNDLQMIYIRPNLNSYIKSNFGFDPSGGVQAFYYFSKIEKYNIISVIGFDFYVVGSKPYYFNVEEGGSQLRNNLIKKEYKGYRINKESGHKSKESIAFCHNIMKESPEIKFNIISNNLEFNSISEKNVNIIKNL